MPEQGTETKFPNAYVSALNRPTISAHPPNSPLTHTLVAVQPWSLPHDWPGGSCALSCQQQAGSRLCRPRCRSLQPPSYLQQPAWALARPLLPSTEPRLLTADSGEAASSSTLVYGALAWLVAGGGWVHICLRGAVRGLIPCGSAAPTPSLPSALRHACQAKCPCVSCSGTCPGGCQPLN